MKPIDNYINHIVLVLDASSSMRSVSDKVIDVADAQIAYLAKRSQELDQETRVTVYTFDTRVKCLIYDKDVLRLPSLRGHYVTGGMTALLDATIQALNDLNKTPQLYGDHAFLIYVLTDGDENSSKAKASDIAKGINGLPDNWTLGVLVPNQTGVFSAKGFGFPAGNIAVWDSTNASGVSEVGETIRRATDNYMTMRSTGIRGSRNLFSLDATQLRAVDLKQLNKMHPGQYRIYHVDREMAIAPFVELQTGVQYRMGSAYYQINKTETIQPQKQLVVMDNKSKYVYAGSDARSVLGLPDYELKVSPITHPNYTIFVQSTSVNRKLIAGTELLVMG